MWYMDEREYLLSKLKYTMDPLTTCWVWNYPIKGRYPHVRRGGAGSPFVRAHRLAYEIYRGEIEPGYILLHACDNKRCINPWHLFAGVDLDNMRDFAAKQGPRRGEANNKAKLKAEDIPVIFDLAEQGVTHKAIAEKYGVSRPAISQVLRGGAWGHVSRAHRESGCQTNDGG